MNLYWAIVLVFGGLTLERVSYHLCNATIVKSYHKVLRSQNHVYVNMPDDGYPFEDEDDDRLIH